MMYKRVRLDQEVVVESIITFHYYELSRTFYTEVERHDFWEFVYVDKGELHVRTDRGEFLLKQGEVSFYKPNELHGGGSNKTSTNLIIITFDCFSPAMRHLENKRFSIDNQEQSLLTLLVKEGYNALTPRLDKPFKRIMHKKKNAIFGSQQLIKIYLEAILIHFIRRLQKQEPHFVHRSNQNKKNTSSIVSQQVAEFLASRIDSKVTLKDVCRTFAISRSRLTHIFKTSTGLGVIEYLNFLKLEKAKILIREERYSFTEISQMLGYTSIHYFSRYFKRLTQMTPTEYSRSVKAQIPIFRQKR